MLIKKRMGEYLIQPNLSPTFYLLVHFSHCIMDIFNWLPHLHLKINTSMPNIWSFPQANSSLGCPHFLKSHHSPRTFSFVPYSYLVITRSRSSLSLPFLSTSSPPPTWSLGSSLTLCHPSSALFPSSIVVMLLSCGKPSSGLRLHSLVCTIWSYMIMSTLVLTTPWHIPDLLIKLS